MQFYEVSEEDKAKIRTVYNVSQEDAKNLTKNLQEWAKTVSHFPEYSQDERFLYVKLVKYKFKEEDTKKFLENYFACIVKHPKVFQNLGKFKPSEEVGVVLPIPKLTQRFERVVILKLLPENLSRKAFVVKQLQRILVTTAMLLYNFDDVPTLRFLVDLEGVSMTHILKINMALVDVFRIVTIFQTTLKARISGIEIINPSNLLYAILAIARMVLKPKLASRITVHDSIATLSTNIALENLPSDYGGNCENMETLLENWDHTIANLQEHFKNYYELDGSD